MSEKLLQDTLDMAGNSQQFETLDMAGDSQQLEGAVGDTTLDNHNTESTKRTFIDALCKALEGMTRISRFNFKRRPDPKTCMRKKCCLTGETVAAGSNRSAQLHPHRCPTGVAQRAERKWLRQGKELVLPDGARIMDIDDEHSLTEFGGEQQRKVLVVEAQDSSSFQPHVVIRTKYGRCGRVHVLRYHPYAGSANTCGQVVLRCNWDVQ